MGILWGFRRFTGVSRDFNRFTRGTLDKRRVREGCGDRGGQGMGMSRTGCEFAFSFVVLARCALFDFVLGGFLLVFVVLFVFA